MMFKANVLGLEFRSKYALTVVFVVWGVILECRNGYLRKQTGF